MLYGIPPIYLIYFFWFFILLRSGHNPMRLCLSSACR
ncbi:ATP-dependent zinc metalloprotease FtsH 2 [Frankliniella fusca]|uniref:ATP-dependent zinc metalloprotease FtsH 2 n=1 Tax=Frankliniella fusca TaxID=407009 RepID=A0AAE1LMQ5_9NEOP|nr:ATP-dependent zinc metalloprotease FtsH 2 [Frankliniella fusca]